MTNEVDNLVGKDGESSLKVLGMISFMTSVNRAATYRIARLTLISCVLLFFVTLADAGSHPGTASSARPTNKSIEELGVLVDVKLPANRSTFEYSSAPDGGGGGGNLNAPEDSDEEDDDEDDDDRRDPSERTKNVVVAAVPILLGVLTVLLMCVFMFCCRRNSRRKQQLKYAIRQHRACMRPTPLDSDVSDNNSICEEAPPSANYVPRRAMLPDPTSTPSNVMILIGPSMSMPPLGAPQSPASSPPPPEDLPPSYDEVMRSESRRDVVSPLPARFDRATQPSAPHEPPTSVH